MEKVKIPGPMRIVWGSATCYWLAGMINPGFYAIAMLLLLMLPIIILENNPLSKPTPKSST